MACTSSPAAPGWTGSPGRPRCCQVHNVSSSSASRRCRRVVMLSRCAGQRLCSAGSARSHRQRLTQIREYRLGVGASLADIRG